jgi:hypothetical protein
MTDAARWLERGRELGCFPTDAEQIAYWQAWEGLDDGAVRRALWSIFAFRHRMPIVNWLGRRADVEALDEILDGPNLLPEEWMPSQFAIRMPSGVVLAADWLIEDGGAIRAGAIDAYVLELVVEFLRLPLALKAERMRVWQESVDDAVRSHLLLDALVTAYCRARLIAELHSASSAIRELIPETRRASALLEERLGGLGRAWWLVLGRPPGGRRLLSFGAIDAATGLVGIKQLLLDAEGPLSANLMSYLRCEDTP